MELCASLQSLGGSNDLLLPTWIQAVGGAVMVVATVALAWTTWMLVKATHGLTDVGGKTWQSNVLPKVSVSLHGDSFNEKAAATVHVLNKGAVLLNEVNYRLIPMFHLLDANGEYVCRALSPDVVKDERLALMNIGSFGPKGDYAINVWDIAIRSLQLQSKFENLAKQTLASHHGATSVACGFTLSLGYRHSVTNYFYMTDVEYQVVDRGMATIAITEIATKDDYTSTARP